MKKFLEEFKEFALRGNVLNLAVGVIIGAAFQGVVNSLTTDLLSPLLGLFTRETFQSLQLVVLGVPLRYGAFVTEVINFFIMAFVVFLMVRGMNRVFSKNEKKDEKKPEPQATCPYCFTNVNPKATRCPACTSALEERVL